MIQNIQDKDNQYVPIMIWRKAFRMLKNKSKNDQYYDDMLNRFMDFYEKENSIKIEIVYLWLLKNYNNFQKKEIKILLSNVLDMLYSFLICASILYVTLN